VSLARCVPARMKGTQTRDESEDEMSDDCLDRLGVIVVGPLLPSLCNFIHTLKNQIIYFKLILDFRSRCGSNSDGDEKSKSEIKLPAKRSTAIN
jgi:hypothetical protein